MVEFCILAPNRRVVQQNLGSGAQAVIQDLVANAGGDARDDNVKAGFVGLQGDRHIGDVVGELGIQGVVSDSGAKHELRGEGDGALVHAIQDVVGFAAIHSVIEAGDATDSEDSHNSQNPQHFHKAAAGFGRSVVFVFRKSRISR